MKKIKLMLIAIIVLFVIPNGLVFASFPVKKETKKMQVRVHNLVSTTVKSIPTHNTDIPQKKKDVKKAFGIEMDEEMIFYLALWLLLGWAAAHRWFRGKPIIWNVLFILTAGGLGVWAIVDLINILTGKF